MVGLANWLARIVWFGMLWFMRRPPIKAMRRGFVVLLPPSKREAAWQNVVNQDRFARRHGRRFLAFFFAILIAWVFLGLSYAAVVAMVERGALSVPEEQLLR